MSFTDQECEFIRSQGIGRLATVGPGGQPDVVPVAVEFDGEHFWVGGPGAVAQTRKFRNVAAGSTRVSIVFDDLLSMDPFVARGIRVYGEAQQPLERVGMVGPGTYMRIAPTTSWSWNLAGEPAGEEWYSVARREHTTKATWA